MRRCLDGGAAPVPRRQGVRELHRLGRRARLHAADQPGHVRPPESPLGAGRGYVDKDGFERTRARYRWWDPAATTLRGGAEILGEGTTPTGEPLGELPDDPLDVRSLPRYTDDVPVVDGHHWRSGTPAVARPTVACVDYSAGKGGDLVAYRWSGETALRDEYFLSCPGTG